MSALFNIFMALVVALAATTFAHFGVAMENGVSARPNAESPRTVKRSPVQGGRADLFIATASR